MEEEGKVMSLQELRSTLIRLEETIIFALIERAQFLLNSKVYKEGSLGNRRFECSFLDYMFKETEKVHALVLRYTSPEEHPFFPDELPSPILPLTNNHKYYLKPNHINYNNRIKTLYENIILPLICKQGDDNNYGSSATCDIHILQAISKRVHYGKYVAEVKFQKEREKFISAINDNNTSLLMDYITNKQVEDKLLERVLRKASTYGQDIELTNNNPLDSSNNSYKVSPNVIVDLYKNYLIPITKDIEVDYLLQRLNSSVDVAFLGPFGTFTNEAASKYFNLEKNAALIPCDSIPNVIEAVLSNKVNYGVIPFCNSFAGFVPVTVDLLYKTSAHVCGEITIPISLHLVSKSGTKISDIKTVYSHPHAISQCRNWIKSNLPSSVTIIETKSTAEAARLVQSMDNSAALSSQNAAQLYDLQIIMPNAQDTMNNYTRFLIVSTKYSSTTSGDDRSLLRFTLANTAGSLSSTLSTFGNYNINLHHIESRMIKNADSNQSKVLFFIECSGHTKDESFSNALNSLSTTTDKIEIIGSFSSYNKRLN